MNKNKVINGIGDFTNFNEEKPKEGLYFWKIKIETFEVVVPEHVRKRHAGFKEETVPLFSYWNGYSLEFPPNMKWQKTDGDCNTKTDHSFRIISGIELKPCPFCKEIPLIGYSWIGNIFWDKESSDYSIKCCSWINSSGFKTKTLTKLVNIWNKKLS